MDRNARTFALAILFEAGLGFAGVALAEWAGLSLQSRLEVTPAAVARGLLASLPMLAGLVVLTHCPWSPIARLQRQVEGIVREVFAESRWFELALICLAAGLGEELLFRGALQPWVGKWTPPAVALATVSLLFGAAHAMSAAYFVAATLIGLYFGWLTMAFNDLVAPIVAHALYDFVAILYLQHQVRQV